SPEELFDPCINVSIGTAMLSEFDYGCARVKPGGRGAGQPSVGGLVARRTCALHRYADAIRLPDLVTVTLDLRYQSGSQPCPADAPIFPAASERRLWGSDHLLMAASTIAGVAQAASRGP
ncbi:MAG TPA: hypothetical protein VKU41_31935, partial [Polyangiaceae bacterium]|nr:hypothetical protein [Polyangiaceae bacterium]